MSQKPRYQIQVKLNTGDVIVADIVDGSAIFTCKNVELLKKLYKTEKAELKIWHEKRNAFSILYPNMTKDEIKNKLSREAEKVK